MVAALAVRWQTSRAKFLREPRIFGLAHQRQGLRDALIRNQAQKWRLLQLRRKSLPQRAVKNRIAGSVGEVGQNDRVFFGELGRATMQEEIGRTRSRDQDQGLLRRSTAIALRVAQAPPVILSDSLSRFSRCRSERMSAAL